MSQRLSRFALKNDPVKHIDVFSAFLYFRVVQCEQIGAHFALEVALCRKVYARLVGWEQISEEIIVQRHVGRGMKSAGMTPDSERWEMIYEYESALIKRQ